MNSNGQTNRKNHEGPIRLLIVDDSALVRDILARGLSQAPDIEVVGTAKDPYDARDQIVHFRPDVLTLDVEMPRMDGVEFLRKLMPQYPLPVIMVSALTERGKTITLDALDAGAVDFVTKPSVNVASGLNAMLNDLVQKIRVAATVDVSHLKTLRRDTTPRRISSQALAESTDKVIAIGASTGGTEAIREVITAFPRNTPGVVIVQHMPAGFTRKFAERLNGLSEMDVKEAESGDRVFNGRVLIAPGDFHMEIIRSGGQYKVNCKKEELVNGHRPSVEVLFDSIARYVGANAVGVMLTGMGADGADAMARMREAGARTLAQDEQTSVVFGMPKEAWKRGGAEILVPLPNIARKVIDFLGKK